MQRKLTLRLDDLAVDTFQTTAPENAKGTVLGEQMCTCPTACSCPGCPSCDGTCPATCYNTCDDYSCANTCGDSCDACYSDACNSYAPCPTPAYTNCGRYLCY